MRLAVTGDESVVGAIRATGATVVDPDEATSSDIVVAVGEKAVVDATLDSTGPVLPVDCGTPWSVPRRLLGDTVDSLLAGDIRAVDHPILSVSVDGDHVGRALFDVMLVTSEPARISEYAVSHRRRGAAVLNGRDENDTDVTADATAETAEWRVADEFRADGVVVASPLGSSGYARAAGGSVVGVGAGLSVVPVSPYATRTDSWVFDPPLRLSVERDDAPVSLVVDDTVARPVAPHESVVVEIVETASLLVG
ncbi:ATP-NAD kinase [Haloferax elongans ATCC BAA-1513]|uniref:ATP-NAD kinase n=1 Tax=Haloferax elongans ATCC BAA-1513 TaxID=1230453 RepID=M0HQF6_HALEO|nr:NAD(+)/NADH kinase [Haloferax elongans]ELZ86741.1 ATP-NAD kinase [Haloferax elongans ATCC BAA-1513]